MNIGIIGSGNIGANTARLCAKAGHQVAISNSRGPDSLRPLAEEIGDGARAATIEEAADFGEVVLVTIPFFAYEVLPADRLAGKIVVDATNYYPGRDGQIDFGGLTSSELVARHLPDARLVKAFNTMYYETSLQRAAPETTASCSF
jgi:predicted dinucleotide-binding enzyme